ncbi:TPA: hypothetical protein ACIE98_000110 [Citrobacter koseri]|uniref:hypothetical protein n=1 Tax=Citrobacter sp. CK207 TaxID=2985116 RepID=UPI001A1A8363|nr:hypothetical protein [Citrobacter sp. CK207]HAT3930897.1 hypothetical protein [Citrobacter koseri]MDM2947303.1 hypothetical protein [Citrobacter sp. CK207]HEM6827245.1 hypothetical protein [Citrobacter koseri]HEM6877563.1 hypothetical protein [Citrobacter koseri]HEM8003134.1 hypothetical protein [Citrobacter koseri]
MTTITRERLLKIQQWRETYGPGSNVVLPAEEAEELARIALASLEANKQELKIAELINKYYERYPLATFKSDTGRAEALGFFMAGAELQCFGEFVEYKELCGDE